MTSGIRRVSEGHLHNKISFISFVCSILVIYYHTLNLQTYGIVYEGEGASAAVYCIESYWSKITQIAVPFFYFISGMLFYRTFDISKLLLKWKSRIHSIVIPYVIWCLVYYFYYVLCTNIPMISSFTKTDKVALGLLEAFRWIFMKEYYTLWFLKNLILYIFAAPMIWFLLSGRREKKGTGLIVLIGIILFLQSQFINTILVDGLEYYLIGAWIGLNHRNWIQCTGKGIEILAFIALAGIGCFLIFGSWNGILKTVFILSIWYVLDLLELEKISFPWWMNLTFFTYVAHDLFLEAFEKLFLITFGKNPVLALIDYLCMPVLVFLFLVFIAYVGQKKFPRAWELACGGR